MKKIVISLMAAMAVFGMVACVDVEGDSNTSTVDSHDVSTIDSHNVTYVREDATVTDENGTEIVFETVCHIDVSNVTADGGVILIHSETSTKDLTSDIRIIVGGLTVVPVLEYTASETVKIYARADLLPNNTEEEINGTIEVYATDGETRVDICGGVYVQPPTDSNETL